MHALEVTILRHISYREYSVVTTLCKEQHFITIYRPLNYIETNNKLLHLLSKWKLRVLCKQN